MLLKLKVRLSEITADMLRTGDCFCLPDHPAVFYTVLNRNVKDDNIGVNVISLPSSRPDYLALDARQAVYLIWPEG